MTLMCMMCRRTRHGEYSRQGPLTTFHGGRHNPQGLSQNIYSLVLRVKPYFTRFKEAAEKYIEPVIAYASQAGRTVGKI